jgi:hypothetical protein
MRAIIPLNSPVSFRVQRARVFFVLAIFIAALGLVPMPSAQPLATAAASGSARKPSAQHKRSGAVHAKHKTAKTVPLAEVKPAVQATSAAQAAIPTKPAEPEMPKWPVNEKPAQAAITWDSKGLRIEAANSSLQQILRDVAIATGAEVEGMNADERIFGVYGPGTARDVLGQLLLGTGYNVLMVGDQGQGTPREIVLSSRHGGGTAAPAAKFSPDSDDDDDDDDANEQPSVPLNGRPGGHRTPQQITQEMQQRQQELREHQMPGQPPSNDQPQ